MCNCIAKHNSDLKQSGRRIDATFSIGDSPSRVVVNTYSISLSVFTPPAPPLIVAEFCPFCGKPYGGVTPATEEAPHANS